MSLTYGFYNSDEGDRRYNSVDISRIFDGLISDGVYQNVGNCMMVTVDEHSENLLIATGRAWFNHTWSYNDAVYMIDIEDNVPEPVASSTYYAIVLQVDRKNRINTFEVLKGLEGINPSKPSMLKDDINEIYQYPIAYILRTWNRDHIPLTQSSIENAVGTEECPFVAALLEPSFSLDDLIADLRAQYVENVENDTAYLNDKIQTALNNITGIEAETTADILAWYNNLTSQIDENAAVNLQNQIGTLENLKTDKKTNLVEALNSNITVEKKDVNQYMPWVCAALYSYTKEELQNSYPGFPEFEGMNGAIVLSFRGKMVPLDRSATTDESVYASDIYIHPGDVILCAINDPKATNRKNSRWIQNVNTEGFQIGTKNITITSSGTTQGNYVFNESSASDGVLNRIIPGTLIGNHSQQIEGRYSMDMYSIKQLLDGPEIPGDVGELENIIGYPYYRSGTMTVFLVYLGMLEYKNNTYRIFSDITNPGLSELNPAYTFQKKKDTPLDAIVTKRFIDSMYGEIVWRNPDSLGITAFTPKEILYDEEEVDFENGACNVNLEDYVYFEVEFRPVSNSNAGYKRNIVYPNITTRCCVTGYTTVYSREMTIYNKITDSNNYGKKIVFSTGYSGTTGNLNGCCVPIQIIGYRHSGVAKRYDAG